MPDGDALEYAALSLAPSVAEAAVAESGVELALRAVGAGAATVYVWATDPGGLRGSLALPVTVTDRRPPQAQLPPALAPLEGGDDLRLALASLIRAGAGDPDALRWRAWSSDESVATARVVGDHLVVTPEPGGEGVVEITLEAVDEADLAGMVPIRVQVEFHWPARQAGSWRAQCADRRGASGLAACAVVSRTQTAKKAAPNRSVSESSAPY